MLEVNAWVRLSISDACDPGSGFFAGVVFSLLLALFAKHVVYGGLKISRFLMFCTIYKIITLTTFTKITSDRDESVESVSTSKIVTV